MSELSIVLPAVAGVAAGLVWSTLGIWSKYKSGGVTTIDKGKLKKNIAVGAGTGIATWIYTIIQGDPTPVITSVESFALAAAGYFPVVVVVDKLLTRKEEPKTK